MIIILYLGMAVDTAPGDTVDIIHYQAKEIVYDLEKSLITLSDSSIITYRDIKLTSDSAYYHIDENVLEAFGNCDLRQMGDSIKGDYLKYNIENRKALMTNARTQIGKGFLEGKKVIWVSKDVINAYDGVYTTCSNTPPHYYFYSPKMKIYLGDMVIARPIFLYIQGVPVVAAPFWFVPISKKRKSGLLPFRAGNSRDFGKFIRGFAYYFVISDYADLTLQVDAMEKKGIMPHLEAIWDYNPFTKGTIHSSYIKETDTRRKRYSIEARNSSPYFLLGSSFNCDIHYISDNQYQQDFTDTTVLWLKKEISSQATITGEFNSIKNTLFFERMENIADSTIIEKLPGYSFSTPSRLLFSTINYSVAGHFTREQYQSSVDTTRVMGADISTAPSFKQNILGLFTISPRVNFDLAGFDQDTAGNRLRMRAAYSFTTSATTIFYRIFGLELLGFHGILHKVIPQISYSYTPDFHSERFPVVSGIPRFTPCNQIAFGIGQEFEAKFGEELKKIHVLKMNWNGAYNLLTDSLTPFKFFGELPANLFPGPISSFNLNIRGEWNPYNYDYTYTITNSISFVLSFFSINLNQSYTKAGTYQIWFNGKLKPTRNWLVSYSARYDWETKRLVNYSFNLQRDLHCWQANFSFNQLGDVWRYDFKVQIKEIPEVQIGKGLLGYIFE